MGLKWRTIFGITTFSSPMGPVRFQGLPHFSGIYLQAMLYLYLCLQITKHTSSSCRFYCLSFIYPLSIYQWWTFTMVPVTVARRFLMQPVTFNHWTTRFQVYLKFQHLTDYRSCWNVNCIFSGRASFFCLLLFLSSHLWVWKRERQKAMSNRLHNTVDLY